MNFEPPYKNLSFARITAKFWVTKSFTLPPFTGSIFHGVLGNALKAVSYDQKRRACHRCACQQECKYIDIFTYLFKTPSDHPYVWEQGNTVRPNQKTFPNPIVLDPPQGGTYQEGDIFIIEAVIIGTALVFINYLACSLRLFTQASFGNIENCLILDSITDQPDNETSSPALIYRGIDDHFTGTVPIIYNFYHLSEEIFKRVDVKRSDGLLRIQFLTPFNLQENNKPRKSCDFKVFIARLLDRIELLSVHSPLDEPIDKNAMLNAASQIETEDNTKWYNHWKHNSSGQNELMILKGLLGDIVCSGNLIPFLPYIKIGEFLHVGKQTTFGLGKYRVMGSQM